MGNVAVRARRGLTIAPLLVRQPRQLRHLPRLTRTVGRSLIDVGIPWLAFDVIDWLSSEVGPSTDVFEYGGGGSTVWFAKHARSVVTIESDSAWVAMIRTAVRTFSDVDVIERGPEDSYATYISAIDAYPDDSFDLVVVDGRERVRCIERATAKVRFGGKIMLDDSERPRYARVRDVLAGWPCREFRGIAPGKDTLGYTTVWTKPPR